MKRTMLRPLAILFSVLLFLGNLMLLQPEVGHAQTLENAVTIMAIDENGDNVLPLTAIGFKQDETAFDVLQSAVTAHGMEIEYDEYDFGNVVTAIGEVQQADPLFWSMIVMGKATEVGASSYKVTEGEHIVFALSDKDNFFPEITSTVTVVDINGTAVIPEMKVNVVDGASAYDGLYQAAKESNVILDASINDTYFTFINNVGETELGANDYWNIAINDQSIGTSIVAHPLKEGDHVRLTVQTFEEDKVEKDTPKEEQEEKVEDEEASYTEKSVESTYPLVTEAFIQTNIDEVMNYFTTNNIDLIYGSEWWIWGVAHTDQAIPASYITSVEEKVIELDGEFRNIFDLEKVIIGLSAAGADPTSIAGYDLVDKLIHHAHLETPAINAAIYGLLALDSGNYEAPTEVRKRLVETILANGDKVEGGGWSFFGSTPSPDITGMALAALAPYQDDGRVKTAIDEAVAYLSEGQDDTSGYTDQWNGGDSSESVSQVIVGLVSVGIDPTSAAFTKEGGNLLQHLVKFKHDDGGFMHLLDDSQSYSMSTQQALLALVAYKKYVNQSGLVYQFPLPVKEEEEEGTKPENPETDVPENAVNAGELKNEDKEDEGSDKDVTGKEEEKNKSETDETNENIVNKNNSDKTGEKLPDTATTMYNLLAIGAVLIISGALLLFIKRRKIING
ncbi:DUF4430 domain-containing protein [Virgibacillus sp. C22-A2]|uniref:DUF4430 domain-containing protein n=1 Tax=Virgibacillus tibetensis TaxID=3042313 RepID=A0ABU6KD84_9BACI|nr:DUF4430 domain-containing protein [Virgibacillus sp. C22-A2]